MHAKNNFIQRQFLPVFFWICTKDACSFRQKEVFPRMRAACNINYQHSHYFMFNVEPHCDKSWYHFWLPNWNLNFTEIYFTHVVLRHLLFYAITNNLMLTISGKYGPNFYCTLFVKENHVCCLTTFARHISKHLTS